MCMNFVCNDTATPEFYSNYHILALHDALPIPKGCELAGCALIGGETAEMPDMYAKGEYDLAGYTVGAVEKSELRDGAHVEAGDVLVGIASSGPHSNGYSLVRRIFDRAGRDRKSTRLNSSH